MIRKCFTINPMRTKEEIKAYEESLVKTKRFLGCEIFYPYNVSETQYQQYVEGIQSLLQYEDFEIVCHLPHGRENNLATHNNETKVMERMKKAMDFASQFFVKRLTLHPGEIEEGLSKEEATQISICHVKELVDYAKQYKMVIMIENLVGTKELCLTKEEMKNYLQQFKHQEVKLIFDCGHCHASHTLHPSKITDFVQELKQDLFHIHISDNHGISDEHGPIGSGTIDFVAYFQTLKNIGYTGLYCSEVLFHTVQDLMDTSDKMDEIEKKIK